LEEDENGGIRFTIQTLRTLTSVHLSGITLGLRSTNLGDPDPNTWAELGSLIESPRFLPTLQRLIFLFGGLNGMDPQSLSDRKQWIEERFRLCAARGLLHVTSHP
jgi:hypothetical protein